MLDNFEKTIFTRTLNINLSKLKDSTVSLSTLCTDIFLIVISMREEQDLGTPESLRKLLKHYIELFMQNCNEMNIDSKISKAVKFALVALIDETVLSIPGICCDQWSGKPLQFEYYGELNAGDKFYEYLQELMQDATANYEALETFYYCLSLGFEGKYLGQTDDREKVIKQLATVLINTRRKTRLVRKNPEMVPVKKRVPLLFPPWTIIAAAAGIAAIVWTGAAVATHAYSKETIRLITAQHSKMDTIR